MQFDFAAFLVLAAVVTGIIWLLDVLILAPRRARAYGYHDSQSGVGTEERKLPWYIDVSRSFFPVIVAVLILRSFIVEPFRIPSDSMVPTLLNGDFILVNKFAFGVRLPVINTKILDTGEPERGDVAVFRYPRDPGTAFIKRIVGLPGDVLEYRDKQLYINGQAAEQNVLTDDSSARRGYQRFTETIDDRQHLTQVRVNDRGWMPSSLWNGLDAGIGSGGTLTWRYKVPEGQYFAMGDNRDNSSDSRFWGTVPEQNLIGEAFFIWMNSNCIFGKGDCGRIGSSIE